MKCIYCSAEETEVADSRKVGDTIRRRRECKKCGTRFTTYEVHRSQHQKDDDRKDIAYQERKEVVNDIRKLLKKYMEGGY